MSDLLTVLIEDTIAAKYRSGGFVIIGVNGISAYKDKTSY